MLQTGVSLQRQHINLGEWNVRQYARQLYYRSHRLGRLRNLWARLTKRSCSLHSLADIKATHSLQSIPGAEAQVVPIHQIHGSWGRCDDFDDKFHPLNSHNEERWVRVLIARIMGRVLPPIKLIRVRDIYFVVDGHHRVSVAHTLGEKHLDALVTAWDMAH